MLSQHVTEPARTEWETSTVIALKKNGLLYFWVEYRPLNNFTRRDSYFVPYMNECIDLLAEATIFSTLEASRRY